MKIFVAGASGVIGRELLPKLIETGHKVIGTTRHKERTREIEATGASAVVVDALDRNNLMSVFAASQPDVVIHQLTALSHRDFDQTSRLREEGTRNLIDAALAVGVKHVIAQSISFAYEPGEVPATEDVPLDVCASVPRKQLVASIRTLEFTVKEMPHYVILRYGAFYGPDTFYANDGFVAHQIRQKQIPATDAITSFIHVNDAASATVLALGWPSGVFNIVDDEPVRGIDWIPAYAEASGAPLPDIRSGREGWERGASNAKARQYGWKPAYPTWKNMLVNLHGQS